MTLASSAPPCFISLSAFSQGKDFALTHEWSWSAARRKLEGLLWSGQWRLGERYEDTNDFCPFPMVVLSVCVRVCVRARAHAHAHAHM